VNSEIRSLTGLRGIAALLVAILHIHQPSGDNWLSTFFRHGYLAVDLFFVLSGFVMALTYGVMFREGFSGKAYGIFLAKRLARVYPLYLILTVTFAGLAVMVGAQWVYGKNFAFVVAANLALVQAWGMAPSLTPAAWSISTEWAAYLLFPWLAIGVLHGRRTYVCIWAVICAGSIAALALNNSHFIRPNGPGGYGPLDVTRFDSLGPMVRCIASFSLGITAYRLRGVPSIRKWLENSNVSSLLCIITLGLACIPNADVFVVMTFPALVTSLSLHKSGISSFLSSKATYSLGLWSSSLYLVPLPFRPAQISLAATLSASIPWGASVLASVLILTVVLMLSMVTYFAIEKPSRTLLQSVLRLRADSASNTKCESSSRSSAQMADPHG